MPRKNNNNKNNKRNKNNNKRNRINKKKKDERLKISEDIIIYFLNNDSPSNKNEKNKDIKNIKIKSRKKPKNKINLDLKKIKVDTIDDLINLGKKYDPTHNTEYNIDLKILHNILEPLTELKNMIGMKKVKQNIVNHIVYFLLKFHDNKLDLLHTVIQGPPGAGKTELGKILGKIYYRMGVIKGNNTFDPELGKDDFKFKIVKRSDLIAKYLGQTAIKTQNVIDQASGGILFIDEAYSIGDAKDGDSFAKECIDTLNQNLTEKKDFICIIAGYKEDLEKRFFSNNRGLERRFNIRYTIDKYSSDDLREIFLKKVKEEKWKLKSNKAASKNFFKKHYKSFKNLGGDIETLLFNCKIEHSKRVFSLDISEQRLLSKEDVVNGYKLFISNQSKDEKKDNTFLSMYN